MADCRGAAVGDLRQRGGGEQLCGTFWRGRFGGGNGGGGGENSPAQSFFWPLKRLLPDALLPFVCALCGDGGNGEKGERFLEIYPGHDGLPAVSGMAGEHCGFPGRKPVSVDFLTK